MSSLANRPVEILHALREMFAVIGTEPPYSTGIGREIVIGDVVGASTDLPSMGLLVTSGQWGNPRVNKDESSQSRSLDLLITAAVSANTGTAQYAGLQMLQDIETACARRDLRRMAGVWEIQIVQWQIVDRPDGIDAVLLLITAEAAYSQPKHL